MLERRAGRRCTIRVTSVAVTEHHAPKKSFALTALLIAPAIVTEARALTRVMFVAETVPRVA